MLVTAHNAGEELLAKARAEADQLRGSAERQRDDLLHAARAQADAITTDAGASLESLRREDEQLRRSIAEHRAEFAAFLRSALAQLDGTEAYAPPLASTEELAGELLARLPGD